MVTISADRGKFLATRPVIDHQPHSRHPMSHAVYITGLDKVGAPPYPVTTGLSHRIVGGAGKPSAAGRDLRGWARTPFSIRLPP